MARHMGILWSSAAELPPRHLYNLLASILRALGDSRRPLYFLILAALLNIVLDLLLIIKFRMGAAGRHMRPSYPRAYPGFLCLLYIIRKVPELHLGKEDWKMNWDLAKWQMKIGFPMAFQFSITAIGTIVVQSALNMLGSVGLLPDSRLPARSSRWLPRLMWPLGQPWRPIVPRT